MRGVPISRRALSSAPRLPAALRGYRALDGNQEGIEPPWPPQHGARCLVSKEPEQRAGGISAALRSGQWVSHHRGSWAPAFAGETKGGRGGIGKTRRAQSGGELSHRLPGERRDPGTTELWMATKRASNRHGLGSTEGAVFSRAPKHRAGGTLSALRSAP